MRVRVNDRDLTYAARLDVTLTLTSVTYIRAIIIIAIFFVYVSM